MPITPRQPLCSGCAKTQQLLALVNAESTGEPDPNDVIDTLPLLFESALSYLLSEFDYEAQIESNTAIAIRLLAVGAARAEGLRPR